MTSNGQIDKKDLTKLSTGEHYLQDSSARSYEAVNVLFKEEFGTTLTVTDAYRPESEQETIFLRRYDHTPRAGNTVRNGGIKYWKGRTWHKKPKVAVAATPGQSNHGWGRTVDFGAGVNTSFTSKEHLWMLKVASEYGWNNVEGRAIGEPWHFTHVPSNDKKTNSKETPEVELVTKKATKTKQKSAKTWKNLIVDDNGTDVSVNTQAGVFNSSVKIGFQGIPKGDQIQLRAVVAKKDKAGKYEIVRRYPVVERIGTEGGTFVDATQTGKLASGERLRWQFVVYTAKPASVGTVEVQTLVYK